MAVRFHNQPTSKAKRSDPILESGHTAASTSSKMLVRSFRIRLKQDGRSSRSYSSVDNESSCNGGAEGGMAPVIIPPAAQTVRITRPSTRDFASAQPLPLPELD